MSGRRLFGLETEYAVAATGERGDVLSTPDVAAGLLKAAEASLSSLRCSRETGLFLGNGSRFYVDAGAHPEIAGPECLDPWEAVRYVRAGDRLMVRLADVLRQRNPWVSSAVVFAGNVDYGGTGSTWGSHESYCHRAGPHVLRRALVPHLVTRVIYCGAGGFRSSADGIAFTLAPRAFHLTHVLSEHSTHDRGITHTREEPLAGHGYRRLHLICGESLRSDIATWLRVGTTAVVVALVEAGVEVSAEFELADPVDALRTVAADPTCTRPLRLKHGGTATAVDIQRHYVSVARAHLGQPFLPAWAAVVCERWTRMLDRLAAGPGQVASTLDWAIKLAIYRDQVQRRGVAWDALPQSFGEVRADPERLRHMRELRAALFEMDTRWSQLGPDGVFAQLDRAGLVDHRVDGVDRIDEAMDQPPGEGRGHVRGTVIRRLQPVRHRSFGDWSEIFDSPGRRRLDLSDPFADQEIWRAIPAPAQAARAEPVAPETETSLLTEIQRLLARRR